MLIGAHVSPAGGPAKAVERGVERGCDAIQFFNQSPRAWRPRVYSPEEVDAFHAAMGESRLQSLMIHAVYLLNCASEDSEIRGKSLTALVAALEAGAALGAHCVVLHPGSALKGGGPVGAAPPARGAPRPRRSGAAPPSPRRSSARPPRSPRRSRARSAAPCTSRTPRA